MAEAFRWRTRNVDNVSRRRVPEGLPLVLESRQRAGGPVPKLLDGEQEARVIAMRLYPPSADYGT